MVRSGGGLNAADVIPGFEPEGDTERRLAQDAVLLEGLAWGRPRRGHPEGPVGVHVAHLLEMIDALEEPGATRSELRRIALIHDSLKFAVRNWLPKHGRNHHADRARRLAEHYITDERLLATIELHDMPYALWRKMRRGRSVDGRLDAMLRRIPDRRLFLRFVELDASTEGKRPEPVEWLRSELQLRSAAS